MLAKNQAQATSASIHVTRRAAHEGRHWDGEDAPHALLIDGTAAAATEGGSPPRSTLCGTACATALKPTPSRASIDASEDQERSAGARVWRVAGRTMVECAHNVMAIMGVCVAHAGMRKSKRTDHLGSDALKRHPTSVPPGSRGQQRTCTATRLLSREKCVRRAPASSSSVLACPGSPHPIRAPSRSPRVLRHAAAPAPAARAR